MKIKAITRAFALALMPVAGFVGLTLTWSTASISASPEQVKELHVTKECSKDTGEPGSFCTITSSNLPRIKVGSRVYYYQSPIVSTGLQDSNVVLDAGNGNRAVGRCTVELATAFGLCTFSDGMGRFDGFSARVRVSPDDDGVHYHWDGTYSFDRD
jgi:hypothetical protein